MKTKFKIVLGEKQLELVKKIKSSPKQQLVLFDDTHEVAIVKTQENVDMHLFNTIEMMGLLSGPRKIGPDTFTYKLNTSMLQKVVNL